MQNHKILSVYRCVNLHNNSKSKSKYIILTIHFIGFHDS